MIVGLEFDACDDLVAACTFPAAAGGRLWMRTVLARGHSRSLYEVPRVRAGTPRETLVTRTLRTGRLLQDRDARRSA